MTDFELPETFCDIVSIITQAKVSFMPWKRWKVSETEVAKSGKSASFTVDSPDYGKKYRITVHEEEK